MANNNCPLTYLIPAQRALLIQSTVKRVDPFEGVRTKERKISVLFAALAHVFGEVLSFGFSANTVDAAPTLCTPSAPCTSSI